MFTDPLLRFRWAFCQLDSLAQCPHEEAIEKALVSLPQNLEETYRRLIECIPTELKNDAMRLLQFLVHSKRPLKLAEAKEVIATQIGKESSGFSTRRRLIRETDVLRYCPSLVTVVHATNKELRLAHFSVKEYLLRENQFEISTASISITRTCLTYLTDINSSYKDIKQGFPMARYAAEVWTDHAALAQTSEDMARMMVTFLEEEVTFHRWVGLYQADRGWDNDPGPARGSRLYYASYLGLLAPAQSLISKGADVNAQGGEYSNALYAASYRGHQEIVALLLANGAEVNAQGGDYGNALQVASYRGHHEIVTLILAGGADVNAQGGKYGNTLQAASYRGYQEVVALLLANGANVNAQGGAYGNALSAVSYRGHQEIVALLLASGADVNAQGGAYGNALSAASQEGHREIVMLLLKKMVNINMQDSYHDNAFLAYFSWYKAHQAASKGGHQEIFELLQTHRDFIINATLSRTPSNRAKTLCLMGPEPFYQT